MTPSSHANRLLTRYDSYHWEHPYINRLLCPDCYDKEVLGIYNSSSDEQDQEQQNQEQQDQEQNREQSFLNCEECQISFKTPYNNEEVTVCSFCMETKRVKLLKEHNEMNETDKIIEVGCGECNNTFEIPTELDFTKQNRGFYYPYCPNCNNE